MIMRLRIDDYAMHKLRFAMSNHRSRTLISSTEVIQNGLALLDWAVEEVEQGRFIQSANPDGTDATNVLTDGLKRLRDE